MINCMIEFFEFCFEVRISKNKVKNYRVLQVKKYMPFFSLRRTLAAAVKTGQTEIVSSYYKHWSSILAVILFFNNK